MDSDCSILFTSFRLGDLELPNRIVMAPLTGNRASPQTDAANDMMAGHCRQRASADLIITGGSQISLSRQGQGCVRTAFLRPSPWIDGTG
jgi:N-ethylmaleimide reductase